MKLTERYKFGPMFNPPSLADVQRLARHRVHRQRQSAAPTGPGGAYDPETHIAYAPAANAGVASLRSPSRRQEFSDIRYVRGVEGQPFGEVWGPGDCCAADSGYRTRDDLPGASAARPRRARRSLPAADRAGSADRQAAVRPDRGDRSRSRRSAVADAARRHAGQRPQSSGAQGADHSEDRSERQRGPARHQDARRQRRRAGHDDAGASARRHAARVRQADRQGSRRGSACPRRRAGRR